MFARLRARGIRPITIGRRLVEAIDAHANEQFQVPGAYEVRLHPDDFASLEHVRKPLVSELRQVVVNHAQYERYDLIGEASVGLVQADHVTPGHIVIDVARGPLGVVAPSEPPQSPSSSWRLIMDGTTFELVGDVATIGRQGTCTIHIPDINVSRLHAELRRVGDSWTIEDRGSTNGTKINDDLIVRPTTINSGDVVSLGTVHLRVERT